MQDDIFIFTYGRIYIKVRSLKVRWRMLSLVHYNSNMNSQKQGKGAMLTEAAGTM